MLVQILSKNSSTKGLWQYEIPTQIRTYMLEESSYSEVLQIMATSVLKPDFGACDLKK
jgi:hypothetical protein